jgi:hypothetical protein
MPKIVPVENSLCRILLSVLMKQEACGAKLLQRVGALFFAVWMPFVT